MCDFCENILDENSEKGAEQNHIFVRKDGSYWIFAETGDGFCVGNVANIKFCPYCGRKLINEAEKPNIDEIIAKLKENFTEDEQNKLDESIKSFTSGVNGLWEVVRKGIENGTE